MLQNCHDISDTDTATFERCPAFSLHASAIGSQDLTVQLTTLWSALEALLSPSFDDSKITRICEIIVPVLASNYASKLFTDISVNLQGCAKTHYHRAIAHIDNKKTEWLPAAELIVTKDNEARRTDLYREIGYNPLLINRLNFLSESFSKCSHILNTIETHAKRVEWHIRRIYRSRNLLVHAGQSLPYSAPLVENLHSYFHRLIDDLERTYSQSPPPASLESALLDRKLFYNRHLELLRENKNVEITKDNIDLFLAGL